MWRFLNSIPRAFRQQQYHGPCASVSIHVEEGEQERQVNQEVCPFATKHEIKECNETLGSHQEAITDSEFVEEPARVRNKRKGSLELVRSILLSWYPSSESFFQPFIRQWERTKQENGEQSSKACLHDPYSFLNRNHLLEILTVGSYFGFNSESNRKKLLYQVLFSFLYKERALCVVGNNTFGSSSVPLPDDITEHQDQEETKKLHNAKEPEKLSSHIKADSAPESIESAINEFQDICTEYSSKSESLLGLQAAEEGDMSEAVDHLKRACYMGNGSACFNVGLCYEIGCGVSKDIDKAVKFYQRAAGKGHSLAMYNLGLIYLNHNDYKDSSRLRGVSFIEEAAKIGLAEAQTQMGILCMEKDNSVDASNYFKAASDQNDCEAQYFLAMCYEQGLGVVVDMEKAAQLYSLAANAGHEGAMYNLAVFSELGLGGITADPVAATDLYQKAADAGHSLAHAQLEKMEEERTKNQCQDEKMEQNSAASLKHSRSSSNSDSTLTPSASSPNLLGLFNDVTSLFFPETASTGNHQQLSDKAFPEKQVYPGKSQGFRIGEDNVFGLKNIRLSFNVKSDIRKDQSLSKDSIGVDGTELSYPMYGHFHKSHTSPNLTTMVACNI